jgi:hypothetical protein
MNQEKHNLKNLENQEEKVISNKDGLVFSKINTNHYKLNFILENPLLDLTKIIDFTLIQLIYKLNNDVYESVKLDKLNDNEAVATLVMKHFFEDVGLPQRFSHVHIQKYIEKDRIWFRSQSIRSHRPEGVPNGAELMDIKELLSICDVITSNKIGFSFIIHFNDTMRIPIFAEKLISLILNKMFKRVKLFIENMII